MRNARRSTWSIARTTREQSGECCRQDVTFFIQMNWGNLCIFLHKISHSSAGGPAHLSHRLSEHQVHDHRGARQGPLLQLSDHDVPAQPRRHHWRRVPDHLHSAMLQGTQECRGGVRRLRSSAFKALQPDSRVRRGGQGEGLSQGELAKGGEDLLQGGHSGLLERSLPRFWPWSSRSDFFSWLLAKVITLFCWRWHAGILRDLFLNIFSPSIDIFFWSIFQVLAELLGHPNIQRVTRLALVLTTILIQESDLGLPPLPSCKPQSRLSTQNLSKLTILYTFYLHAIQYTIIHALQSTCRQCNTVLQNFLTCAQSLQPQHKRQVYLTLFPGGANSNLWRDRSKRCAKPPTYNNY